MNTCCLKMIFLTFPLLWLDSNFFHVKEGDWGQNPDFDHPKVEILDRFISIDNVCAWPNLTKTNDGNIYASIFNQPSHARREGSVEVWSTKDGGKFWEKSGTAVPHDQGTNRMNVAAGANQEGNIVVIASGWALKEGNRADGAMDLAGVLRAWVSVSYDGGRKWKIHKDGFPEAEAGMTEFIPFGDILPAFDGSLRVLAYAQSLDKAINKVSMFRSVNMGKSWEWVSHISDASGKTTFSGGHNETALFQTGPGSWIAAARRWKAGMALDLFISEDDGKTWEMDNQLTDERQHPGHITALENGELLLTYGNRKPGQFGVAAKTSKDQGNSWSEELIIVDDLSSGDCGYPASVQLEDGSIMTAYYSNGNDVHQRYHMGTVIWKRQ